MSHQSKRYHHLFVLIILIIVLVTLVASSLADSGAQGLATGNMATEPPKKTLPEEGLPETSKKILEENITVEKEVEEPKEQTKEEQISIEKQVSPTKPEKKPQQKIARRNRRSKALENRIYRPFDGLFRNTLDSFHRRNARIQRLFNMEDDDLFDFPIPFRRNMLKFPDYLRFPTFDSLEPVKDKRIYSVMNEKEDRFVVELSNLPENLEKKDINVKMNIQGQTAALDISSKIKDSILEKRYVFGSANNVDIDQVVAKFDNENHRLSIEVMKKPAQNPIVKQINIE